jgi:hypothetical protein
VAARQDDKAFRSMAARQDAAVRAAEPYLSMGYVVDELSPTGVTLRKRGSGPTLLVALLAPATYWIMRPFRRPARYVVLTTDDNGVVSTTYR